jgi:nucleotide-binding universal stress UspA family protein
MYTRMLVPLDGSKTAEHVLPYARSFAAKLKLPVELLAVIDIAEMATHVGRTRHGYIDTMIEETARASEAYLQDIAKTFPGEISYTIERGRADDAIIAKAASQAGTLIAMATHGHSGLNRFLMGSVAEKVLRGTSNPLLLIRASEDSKTAGEAVFTSIVVPLDGSEVAEAALPVAVELAQCLDIGVILFRAYNVPYGAYAGADGYYGINFAELIEGVKAEATEYLQQKTDELKARGVANVSYESGEGLSADEIINFAKAKPSSLIVMSSRSLGGAALGAGQCHGNRGSPLR